jgi:hypothetical protein
MSRFALPLSWIFAVDANLPHWCNGTTPLAVGENDDIDVIWAQAALFSANNGSQALGKLGMFHTALIFQQADRTWTLEFDNAANNNPFAPPGASYYPEFSEDQDTNSTKMEWKWNAARWCLTDDLMWGQDHWKQSFKTIATITPKMFHGIFEDVIYPTNSSDPMAPPFYNVWHVKNETVRHVDVVQDVSCGNGAVWVRDYLMSKGVDVVPHLNVTRIHVTVQDASRVGPLDDEWGTVVDFYKKMKNVYAGTGNMIDKFISMFKVLPLKYAYDGNNATHPYLRLQGMDLVLPEKIKYEEAPYGWGPIPGPNGPIPAPPVPAPPVAPGDFYGKPDYRNQCQPGEKVFQLPISEARGDGAIAKVCVPQCVGGPPDGTCPTHSNPGFWDTPNCNNPDSIIPGSDCVIRCMTNLGCDKKKGAECYIGPKQIGALGICMYRFTDSGSHMPTSGMTVTPWDQVNTTVV